MQVKFYIDPDGEPWRVTEEGYISQSTKIADIPMNGDGYRLMLRFARRAMNSNKFQLVGIVQSEWTDEHMEGVARSCG